MSTEEFYNRHKNNGGDLAKWDGTIQDKPKEQRKPNPNLKRHNYLFRPTNKECISAVINQIKQIHNQYDKTPI